MCGHHFSRFGSNLKQRQWIETMVRSDRVYLLSDHCALHSREPPFVPTFIDAEIPRRASGFSSFARKRSALSNAAQPARFEGTPDYASRNQLACLPATFLDDLGATPPRSLLLRSSGSHLLHEKLLTNACHNSVAEPSLQIPSACKCCSLVVRAAATTACNVPNCCAMTACIFLN